MITLGKDCYSEIVVLKHKKSMNAHLIFCVKYVFCNNTNYFKSMPPPWTITHILSFHNPKTRTNLEHSPPLLKKVFVRERLIPHNFITATQKNRSNDGPLATPLELSFSKENNHTILCISEITSAGALSLCFFFILKLFFSFNISFSHKKYLSCLK